ncbi:uncharacterized protein LOC128792757 [Vidua chalybeata]|uniref:uncharacterized protein LOC128792757 n=1 Tax=Vidua chalybeata TaxID=81927 RepID=UPI0023A84B5E|nr:uncharacterized protein LOC128792757 [Vidua chalybeata]
MSPKKAGLSCAYSPAAEVTLAQGAMPSCRRVLGLSLAPGECTGADGAGAASTRHSSSRERPRPRCLMMPTPRLWSASDLAASGCSKVPVSFAVLSPGQCGRNTAGCCSELLYSTGHVCFCCRAATSAKACDMEGKALLRTTQSCHISLEASGAPGKVQQEKPLPLETASAGCGHRPVPPQMGGRTGCCGCERVAERQVAVLPRGHSAPAEGWGAGSVTPARPKPSAPPLRALSILLLSSISRPRVFS